MTTISEENPHRVILPWGSIIYWRDGVAAGQKDEWTEAEVVSGAHGYPGVRFTRDQEQLLDRVAAMLRHAFDRGGAAKAKDLRRLLGVRE